MRATVEAMAWPLDGPGDALAAHARHLRMSSATVLAASSVEAAAARLGVEVEPVVVTYAEISRVLTSGPAIVRTAAGFLLVVGGSRRGVLLLTPDLMVVRRPLAEMRAFVCATAIAPVADEVDALLARAGDRRQAWTRDRLLAEYLTGKSVADIWLLRSAADAGFAASQWMPSLVAVVAAQVAADGLKVASWALVGWMALAGRVEPGWLLAWGLLLVTLIPCRLLASALGGRLTVRVGAIVQRRLMAGALRLEPDTVRRHGAGDLLGRVLETDSLAAVALAGGFAGLSAAIELVTAAIVLAVGIGQWIPLALLTITVIAAALLGLQYLHARRRWTDGRLALTHALVERMTGHRTRVAQLARPRWHEVEDPALERTLADAATMDRLGVALRALVPHGWCVLGLIGLAPAFVAGGHTAAALTTAIGGVLLAQHAFQHLADALERLAEAAIAWERVAIFRTPVAAGSVGEGPSPTLPARNASPGDVLLEAKDVEFRYRATGEPVLKGLDFKVHAGDRVLLEGASGGGKSTLAGLLAGQRTADAGLVLFGGLDRATVGIGDWRRRVALVPQFHDNHVVLGTFAFNALLGRGWPPTPDDMADAGRVCRALGLGELLDRMPAGLMQMVGETGWQLSHGEKSRLFLARALLQRPDAMILDESFGALDPATLKRSLAYVLAEAPTLVTIAHP